MKKSLAFLLTILIALMSLPVVTLSASAYGTDTVCVIGETEYTSLFGETGAIANAQDDDTIIMVADEAYSTTITRGQVVCNINNRITLDLAGHSVTVTDTGSILGIVFLNYDSLTIRSTVDGLGATDTVTKGSINGFGSVISARADVFLNNIAVTVGSYDDIYSCAFKSDLAGIKLTINNSSLTASKYTLSVGSGFDIDSKNSTITANTSYVIRGNSNLTGSFTNCQLLSKGSVGIEVGSSGTNLTFDACTITRSGYDGSNLKLTNGVIRLTNGTKLTAISAATNVALTNTAKLILDGGTISNVKTGKTTISVASSATMELISGSIFATSTNNQMCATNLYKFVAIGKALYSTSTASTATLISNNADFTKITAVYILDADELAVNCSMTMGAAMRLNEVSGIRYYTTVDSDKIAALKSEGATVEMGTLIAPSDLLAGSELTFDIPEDNRLDVAFKSNTFFTDDTGFEGVVGSIASVLEKNANREFIGRGYVKVTKDGKTTISYASYASYNITNNTRKIAWIAAQIQADTTYYNNLPTDKKSVVDSYATLYLA